MILRLLNEAIKMLPHVLERKFVDGIFDTSSNRMPPSYLSLMLQPSTGTCSSLDAAAFQLGCAHPLAAVRDPGATSLKKEERLKHFLYRLYLQAGIRIFGIRSQFGGLTTALAFEFDRDHSPNTMIGSDVTFINAGEGERYHPTQILLDLLCIVIWELFGKSINAPGDFTGDRSKFARAVGKFCALSEERQHKKIASAIDGKRLCFVGDMNSRILFDYLSLGRNSEIGERKFDLHFTLISPSFAQIEPRYLQGIDHLTGEELHPDIDADFIYPLRWRKEDRPTVLHGQIDQIAGHFRIGVPFMDRLATKNKPTFVLEALPIDKIRPSIEAMADDHPQNLCWLQAWCSLPLRMAAISLGYQHWHSNMGEHRWLLPKPQLPELELIEQESLAEHQRRYFEQKKTAGRRDSVNLQSLGSNLDHLPAGSATLVKRILVANGLPATVETITKDNVPPKGRSGKPKDIMWFQDIRLNEWNPQILHVLAMVLGGELTYNIFDEQQDVFQKLRVGHQTSRIVGILPCPSGVNQKGLEPECICGHPEEIETTSIFDLFGPANMRYGRCFFCGSYHTGEEISGRLRSTLPAL